MYCAKLLQSCPTLCDPVDCSLPGSFVPGILQARIQEWIAVPSSRGSSQPRDQTHICIGRQILYHWGTWEAPISSCMLLNHLEIIQDEFLSHATKIIWKRWNKPSHHATRSHGLSLLSMEFSRQEYWNGLPFPSPGELSDPNLGILHWMIINDLKFIRLFMELYLLHYYVLTSLYGGSNHEPFHLMDGETGTEFQ